jgi:HEAT repeat protein
MRRNWLGIVSCLLVSFVDCSSAPAVEGDGTEADIQTLQEVKIATDDGGLLEFLRRRTLSVQDRTKIQALIRGMGDNAFEVRERSSAQLAALGAKPVPLLRQATRHPDPEIKRRAEECLRQIGDKDFPSGVMAAAVRLLGHRKPDGAVEVLLAYLPIGEDDGVSEEVRASLAAVAIRQGKPDHLLVNALVDKDPLRRGTAAEALCRAGAVDQKLAVKKLLHDPEPKVRLRVGLALAQAGEKDAVPLLMNLLVELPADDAWFVDDFLSRLADGQGPPFPLDADLVSRQAHRDAWLSWWREHGAQLDLTKLEKAPPTLGYTMAILLDAGRILEVDANKHVRWQIDGLQFPLDAQILPGNRVLIAENQGNRVTERNFKGEVLWQKVVEGPIMAQRLPNGHTFIANNDLLMEVDREGKELYTFQRPGSEIMKALKLPNGDIAFASSSQNFIRLNAAGKEIKRFPAFVDIFGGRLDVLPNGHVVVPEHSRNRVVEYDADGKTVWEVPIEVPIAAVRLANGHTLVTSMYKPRGVEVDRQGKVVWEYIADTRVTRLFRR